MAKRDTFLLRIDPAVLEALRRWSEDELRSVNGQIEFLLRRALIDSGRIKANSSREPSAGPEPGRKPEGSGHDSP